MAGVGSLLHELLLHNWSDCVKRVNAQVGYGPLTDFLRSKGIGLSGLQFEMCKKWKGENEK